MKRCWKALSRSMVAIGNLGLKILEDDDNAWWQEDAECGVEGTKGSGMATLPRFWIVTSWIGKYYACLNRLLACWGHEQWLSFLFIPSCCNPPYRKIVLSQVLCHQPWHCAWIISTNGILLVSVTFRDMALSSPYKLQPPSTQRLLFPPCLLRWPS